MERGEGGQAAIERAQDLVDAKDNVWRVMERLVEAFDAKREGRWMTDEQVVMLLRAMAASETMDDDERAALERALHVLRTAPQMEKALEACRKYIPGSMVRSWPPGHRLRDEALKSSADALAAYREGK